MLFKMISTELLAEPSATVVCFLFVMTNGDRQKSSSRFEQRLLDSQAVLFVREALSAAIPTDTSHGTQLKMASRAKIIFGGRGAGEDFLRTNQFAPCYTAYYFRKTCRYSLICKQLGLSGRRRANWISFSFLMQPKESAANTLCTATAGGAEIPDAYFLKNRMAMTNMMISITANTGPMTHSISGCSCCRLWLIWIGSE